MEITKELIKLAFMKTSLIPVAELVLCDDDNGDKCGCAIGALAAAFEKLDINNTYDASYTTEIGARIGLTSDDANALAFGWDAGYMANESRPNMFDNTELYKIGYQAGLECETW